MADPDLTSARENFDETARSGRESVTNPLARERLDRIERRTGPSAENLTQGRRRRQDDITTSGAMRVTGMLRTEPRDAPRPRERPREVFVRNPLDFVDTGFRRRDVNVLGPSQDVLRDQNLERARNLGRESQGPRSLGLGRELNEDTRRRMRDDFRSLLRREGLGGVAETNMGDLEDAFRRGRREEFGDSVADRMEERERKRRRKRDDEGTSGAN